MGKAMLKIFTLFLIMILGAAGISFIPIPREILILLSMIWGIPIGVLQARIFLKALTGETK
jgi:hypothetical protein